MILVGGTALAKQFCSKVKGLSSPYFDKEKAE